MIPDGDDKQVAALDKALTRFVDAYVRGEQPDIDEFVKAYPQHEAQIRRRVQNLREIDGLFDSIVQADAGDFAEAGERNLVGQTVGSFEISAMIGRGGMGVVYLAHDTKLKRSVAVKSIPANLTGEAKAKMRFRREAELLASLNHPNIAIIHDIIKDEADTDLLVLEYIEGETLSQRIACEPLTVEQALSIGQQIASAVSAAHKKGIVHRDLKPGNIKITPEGQVKVLDFGLAKHFTADAESAEASATQRHHIMGTPAYMSPEQARAQPTDHRTDIWSFGCILYQMLTGHLPFEGETATDTLAHIIEHDPDWALLPQETPEAIRTLLRHCLEKDQDKRLDSIGDIATQISDALGRPLATPASVISPRLKRAAMIVGAIVIFVLCAVGVWLVVQPDSRNKRLVVLPFDDHGPAQVEWCDGITGEIRTRLGYVHGLDIIWPESSSEFKKLGVSKQITKKYDLDYVLKGAVQCEDPNGWARIRIQLINAADLSQIWQDSFDKDMTDIFTLQSEVAEEVARALDMTLPRPQRKATPYGYSENSEAHACFRRANQHFRRGSRDGYLKAIEVFEEAIELDPSYAEAHARLAHALTEMYWFCGKNPKLLPKAREAAYKALELAPDMPYARVALGRYYYQGCLDYKNALKHFTIPLRRHPNHRWALKWAAMAQRRMGSFDKALDNLRRAAELDPLNPAFVGDIALTFLLQRKYEDAERYCDQAISLAPDWHVPYYVKACLYQWWQGDTEKARKAIDDGLLHNKDLTSGMGIFQMLFDADLYDRAYEKALKKLKERSTDLEHNAYFIPNALWQAEVYGYMGNKEQEREYYERAVALLEEKVKENPGDDRYHSSLGKAYAGLGNEKKALDHGRRGVARLPVTRDASTGPLRLDDLARIYVMVGKNSEAIDIIEDLLNRDCHLSQARLRLDPVWDPLRKEPRFQRLLSTRR